MLELDVTDGAAVLTALADRGLRGVVHLAGMLSSAEFTSQRRKSVKVKTETVLRLQDGKLAGMTNAHYATKGADSTLQLRTEGTRMP